jgi:hypothetical protein
MISNKEEDRCVKCGRFGINNKKRKLCLRCYTKHVNLKKRRVDNLIHILPEFPYGTRKIILKNRLIQKIGECENCGWKEFPEVLELAHIEHGKEAEKYNTENIILLCPTCHKSFDYGFILVKGIKSLSNKTKYFEHRENIKPKPSNRVKKNVRWWHFKKKHQ